jgi:hypothetical protein
MKKMLMVLAATFICGACLFTSCSKDDEKNDEPTPVANNVYEVTVVALIPQCSAPYMKLNVEYTNAEGTKQNATFQSGDATETLSAEAEVAYKSIYLPFCTGNNADLKESLCSQYIAKTYKMTVPSGKSFSYKGTVGVRSGYTVPTEKFNLAQPVVFSYAKRTSGSGQDNSASALSATTTYKFSIGVHVDAAEKIINGYDGFIAGEANVTMK